MIAYITSLWQYRSFYQYIHQNIVILIICFQTYKAAIKKRVWCSISSHKCASAECLMRFQFNFDIILSYFYVLVFLSLAASILHDVYIDGIIYTDMMWLFATIAQRYFTKVYYLRGR